jgi:hypothetical protein
VENKTSGRLLLTLFYRDSYNYIYSGKENRSGVIFLTGEFDNLDELFHGRKKKKPPVPQTNNKTTPATTAPSGSQ